VAHIIDQAGIDLKIAKHKSLYTPDDFRHIKSAKLIYKGDLNEFNKLNNAVKFNSCRKSIDKAINNMI